MYAAAAPTVPSAVCESHLYLAALLAACTRQLARPPSNASGLRSFGVACSCSCCYRTTFGCAKRLRHAPYSRGAGSKREDAARRLACTLQETETVRLRCNLTVSQLLPVPWPSDTELLIRRRSPLHEPEFLAAWVAALLVNGRVCPWLRSPAVGGPGGGEPFAADSGPSWSMERPSQCPALLLADVPYALH